MSNLNHLLFRRHSALPAPASGTQTASPTHVATVLKNLASMGANPTAELVEAVQAASPRGLREFNTTAIDVLYGTLTGYHVAHMKPLFEDFPRTAMPKHDAQLFLMELPKLMENSEPLAERPYWAAVRNMGVLPQDAAEKLLKQLIAQPSSYSEEDRDDLGVLMSEVPNAAALLDEAEEIPNKENLAHLYMVTENRAAFTARFATATDVLRAAVALGGGDPALADRSVRLGNLPRPARRDLLGALDRMKNPAEDMARHVSWWKRVGEKLHPGEYKTRFPNAASAFKSLREGTTPPSFEGRVDAAMAGPVDELTALLKQRPGVFTRRLDAILRARPQDAQEILNTYRLVGNQVSTPVLVQAHAHFTNRNKDRGSRVYFPKGSKARPWVAEGQRPPLAANVAEATRAELKASLIEKFSELDPMGNVWIDPKVAGLKVPLQLRDASASLRTVGRGSRVKLPNLSVIRGFMWWRDKQGHSVDLDLSAAAYSEDLTALGRVTYSHLEDRRVGMSHSGDFLSAPGPAGAAEFTDIHVGAARAAGVRYVILTVHSFSGQLFSELEGAFAGVQAVENRSQNTTAGPFNMDQVVDRFELSTSATVFTPIAFDLETNEAVWLDLPAAPRISGPNNLESTSKAINAPLEALLDSDAPSLGDLLEMHVEARGRLVTNREDADFVIAEDGDLSPFSVAEVLTDWVV